MKIHNPVIPKKIPIIKAEYNSKEQWKADKIGYFTIKIYPKEEKIRVRFLNYTHVVQKVYEGKNAEELYNTIIRKGDVQKMEHAAYLGSELQKAEIALKKKWRYIQDDPL